MGFDGSSIEGFTRIDESDMIAMPDPDTFRILPWRPSEHHAVARMFCDIQQPDGTRRYRDYRDFIVRYEKMPGVGFLAGVNAENAVVYDAVIGACAEQAEVSAVLTFNASDFAALGKDYDVVVPGTS